MNPGTLYGRRFNNVSLTTAMLSMAAKFDGAIGLFYSPHTCQLGRWTAQGLEFARGEFDLQQVFEARIFNADYEMRWLNSSAGKGQAVFLSERPLELSQSSSAHSLESLEAAYIDTIEQQYVLWGEPSQKGVRVNQNWSRLSTARIGQLFIPISPDGAASHVVLKSREYLGIAEYGNTIVIQERLLGLTWCDAQSNNTAT